MSNLKVGKVQLKRTPMSGGTKPMKRSSIRASSQPANRAGGETMRARSAPAKKSTLKTRQLAVTFAEKRYWSQLAALGCIACMADGKMNTHVSIHHVAGRTAPGCHGRVLPMCAGHHQDGTGEDKTMIAVHPWKKAFEARYGTQAELMEKCRFLLVGAAKEAA